MEDIIKSFDIVDWATAALIITLLGLASWWAHLYENTGILSGVGIGIAIGAMTVVLGDSLREYKKVVESCGDE